MHVDTINGLITSRKKVIGRATRDPILSHTLSNVLLTMTGLMTDTRDRLIKLSGGTKLRERANATIDRIKTQTTLTVEHYAPKTKLTVQVQVGGSSKLP